MRTLVGAFAVAALLCATPVSLVSPHGKSMSVAVETAAAADLAVPARHHRSARYGHYRDYSRLYDRYCGGPYVGGGWNGGTYYGGPWIDLRCYDGVY